MQAINQMVCPMPATASWHLPAVFLISPFFPWCHCRSPGELATGDAIDPVLVCDARRGGGGCECLVQQSFGVQAREMVCAAALTKPWSCGRCSSKHLDLRLARRYFCTQVLSLQDCHRDQYSLNHEKGKSTHRPTPLLAILTLLTAVALSVLFSEVY